MRRQESPSKLSRALGGLDLPYVFDFLGITEREAEILDARFNFSTDGTQVRQQDAAEISGAAPSKVSNLEIRTLKKVAALRRLCSPEMAMHWVSEEDPLDFNVTYSWEPKPDRFTPTWEDLFDPERVEYAKLLVKRGEIPSWSIYSHRRWHLSEDHWG